MKNTLLLFASVITMVSYAKDVEPEYSFKVISDVYDATIPKGKYKLEGKVIEESQGTKVIGVSILGNKEVNIGKSNKKGAFSLLIPIKESEILFSKQGYKKSYFESYEIKEQHRIVIKIYLIKSTKQKEYSLEKPIIYCYTDHPLDVNLSFHPKNELLFSYPDFSETNTWIFHAEPNALLKTKQGTEVPYLFWESKEEGFIDLQKQDEQLKGKIVAGSEAYSYIDQQLTAIGLNATEKTDFITYWAPRMVNEKFVFIQFLQDTECQQFATYAISPAPESFNRIYMVYSSFEEYPEWLKPVKQDLNPIQRKGFYLLEWGGIHYPKSYLESLE